MSHLRDLRGLRCGLELRDAREEDADGGLVLGRCLVRALALASEDAREVRPVLELLCPKLGVAQPEHLVVERLHELLRVVWRV